jgi:predicted aspartyl protease
LGETYTKLRIYGPNGVEELKSLVDTGATFTKVPLGVGERLGLKVRRKVEVKLSDERAVERGLCYAEAEVDGVRDLVPITLGGNDEEPLIGYTTLEILGFKINPITRRLETATPIEY